MGLGLVLRAPASRAAPGPLAVVASFSILADLARNVGGEAVAVSSLVPPDGDPHAFQPRPSDLGALRQAALVIENGLGLEGWLSRMVQASGFTGPRGVLSAGIAPRQLTEHGSKVADPHIWQDPRLAATMVRTLAAVLAKADPARAEGYRERAASYVARILALDAEIAARFAPVPAGRRRIVTTHDAFGYYGARYGITFQAPLGISTESEPSPRVLAALAAQIRRTGTRTVFLENMSNPAIATALAREAGVTVGPRLYADSLSAPDGPAPTYLDLLRSNTAAFLAAIGG